MVQYTVVLYQNCGHGVTRRPSTIVVLTCKTLMGMYLHVFVLFGAPVA